MHYFHGLAAALRLLREKRQLDDEALAQLTGMQRQQVNSYEHGAGMRVDTLDKLLTGLQAGLIELEDALVMVRFLGLAELPGRKRGDKKPAAGEGEEPAATDEDAGEGQEDEDDVEAAELPAGEEAAAAPTLTEDDVERLIQGAAAQLRRYHETPPASHFNQSALASPPSVDGMRVALRGLGFHHVPIAQERACFELLEACAQELQKRLP